MNKQKIEMNRPAGVTGSIGVDSGHTITYYPKSDKKRQRRTNPPRKRRDESVFGEGLDKIESRIRTRVALIMISVIIVVGIIIYAIAAY